MANLYCQCCKQPKDPDSLSVKRSTVAPGHNLILCAGCKEKKHEPRWLIVVAARSYKESGVDLGATTINDQIKRSGYCGNPIEATEIIP